MCMNSRVHKLSSLVMDCTLDVVAGNRANVTRNISATDKPYFHICFSIVIYCDK